MILFKLIRFTIVTVWLYFIYTETQSIYLLLWLGVTGVILEYMQLIVMKNINLCNETLKIEKDDNLNAKDLIELVNGQEKRLRKLEKSNTTVNKEINEIIGMIKAHNDCLVEDAEIKKILDKELN